MANEKVLSISLKDYKAKIDELKGSLLGLDSSTEEYKNTANDLRNMQDKLNEVMAIGKTNGEALEGSYNALSAEMSRLKKEWKATNDEAERASLGNQIVEINDKLKTFDSSIGNFQRNVGNYKDSFVDAFTQMGIGAGSFGNTIKTTFTGISNSFKLAKGGTDTLTTGFKGLNTALGVVGIAFTVITAVIAAAKKGIDSSEESSQKLTLIMAKFKPILDVAARAFQAFGRVALAILGKIADVVAWISENILGLGDDLKKEEEIAALQVEYDKKEGDYRQQNAKYYAEEQRLRKLAEQTKLKDQKQSKKYLEEAEKYAKKQKDNEKELAQLKTKRLKIQSTLADNSEKENDALDEAIAKEKELEGQGYAIEAQYTKSGNKLSKQIESNAEKAKKAAEDAAKAEQELFEKTIANLDKKIEKTDDLIKKQKESQMTELQKVEAGYVTDTNALLSGEKAAFDKNELEYSKGLISKEQYEQTKLDIEKTYNEAHQRNVENHWNNTNAIENKKRDEAIKNELQQEKYIYEIQEQNRKNEALTKGIEFEEDYQKEIEHNDKIFDIKLGGLQKINDELKNKLQDQNLTNEERLKLEEQLANNEKDIDDLKTQHLIENSELLLKQREKEISKEKTVNKQKIAAAQQLMKSTLSISNTIADIMEEEIKRKVESGEITEEEAEKEFDTVKKLQIANSVISTIAGGVEAYMSAIKAFPAPYNIPVAIASAATVVASGIAEIQKIKNTKFGSGGDTGGSSSSSTATGGAGISTSVSPLLNEGYDTQNIQAMNDINKSTDNRVYIVESDIQESNNRVSVRQNQSTF